MGNELNAQAPKTNFILIMILLWLIILTILSHNNGFFKIHRIYFYDSGLAVLSCRAH